jgi:hypothetical protein
MLVHHLTGGRIMKAFLATVLTVIAVGVLAIAYGLLTTRTPIAAAYPDARPMVASERVGLVDNGYALPQITPSPYMRAPSAYPVSDVRTLPDSAIYASPARAVSTTSAPVARVRRTTVVERAPARTWQKTAMVIGGSSAAGAGLGAIVGGKKGALIGAAIGGGAGTLFEVNKRR